VYARHWQLTLVRRRGAPLSTRKEHVMKSRKFLIVIITGLCAITTYLAAQVPSADMATRVVENRKKNAALMQQYTWNSRTELFMKGELKDIRIDQVQVGPDGKLQRTELNNESFSHPRGFLRKAIAESKKKELEQFMQGLKGLLEQYTLPTAGKVLDFMSSANVSSEQAPDGTALLKMQGSGVVVPGDTLSIWADAKNHAMHKVEINTFYEGAAANLTATYKTKPSGLTHMSMAEVDLPDKSISLQIHNYDYEQND
jgi:hypothetical protein